MSQHILVVDDNDNHRKSIRTALEAAGFKIFEAEHGQAALKVLKEQKVHCVVSDILMPVMDGYRLCYEIRMNPVFHAIPVVLFSATYDLNSKGNAMSFGADRYASKQADTAEISTIVKEVMGQKRNPQLAAAQLPTELQVMKEYSHVLIEKLEQRNLELETQAQELIRVNDEIQKFNQAAVGREKKMIDLKSQINALSQELGRKPPYNLSLFEHKKSKAEG